MAKLNRIGMVKKLSYYKTSESDFQGSGKDLHQDTSRPNVTVPSIEDTTSFRIKDAEVKELIDACIGKKLPVNTSCNVRNNYCKLNDTC